MDPRDADLLFNNILFTLYLFVLYGTKFYKKKKKLKYFSDIWLRQTETLKTKGTFFLEEWK